MRRHRLLEIGATVGFLALLVAPASADEQITAVPQQRYSTPNVTIDQGERLTFRNLDTIGHDVTAKDVSGDKPLFSTPVIGNSEEAFVEGSQYLVTGSYGFLCSIHPAMTGTITVTAAGTPVPRPTPGTTPAEDKTKPRVSISIVSRRVASVRKLEALIARLRVDERAKVTLRAVARPRRGGPLVTIARVTVSLPAAGVRRVRLDLTAAGRRALRNRRRSLAVIVTARAVDRAGNRAQDVAGRTLRR